MFLCSNARVKPYLIISPPHHLSKPKHNFGTDSSIMKFGFDCLLSVYVVDCPPFVPKNSINIIVVRNGVAVYSF